MPADHTFTGRALHDLRRPEDLERGESRENYAYSFIHGAYPTKEMTGMKFDVIVGNPPYQIDTTGIRRASTIYQWFVEQAIEMDPRYVVMITPSRWFSGGKGLEEFRERMIKTAAARLVDNPKMFDCFPGVKIRGGVSATSCGTANTTGDCTVKTIQRQLVSTDDPGPPRRRRSRPGQRAIASSTRSAIERCQASRRSAASPKPFGSTNFHWTRPEAHSRAQSRCIYVTGSGISGRDQIPQEPRLDRRLEGAIPGVRARPRGRDAMILGAPIALAQAQLAPRPTSSPALFDTSDEAENYAAFLRTKFVRSSSLYARPPKTSQATGLIRSETSHWTEKSTDERARTSATGSDRGRDRFHRFRTSGRCRLPRVRCR